MSLAAGTRLGGYEIVALIGAGGMGEVYRARDTRLKRDVAIKVLPDAFAQDGERLARFQREAELLATLNHPNIGSVYGFEQSQTANAIVLELIDGETLADRIARGPIPVKAALGIAQQIAEALEAAHERGVIHRDLKPANIKITPDDKVKVLDFGLAKAIESNAANATGGGALTHSPTLSILATQAGMVLGTAAYMSPEQARGFPADQRSDIFAFGTVLYEMFTGRQPFEGDTAPDVLAAVIVRDVDLNALASNLNPRVKELLERCLEKNPKKRWQAIGDIRAEIEKLIVTPLSVAVAPVVSTQPLWKRAAAPLAAAMVTGLAAGYGAWTMKPEPPRPLARFFVPLPADQEFTNTGRTVVALSPDGTKLVYAANRRLYLRALASLETRVIAGTESSIGVTNPVFSPDGQELAFYSADERALKRVAIQGGSAVTICPADFPFGVSWDEGGIVFGQPGKIMRISAAGGVPEVIAQTDAGEMVSTPQLLPDGKSVLFSIKKSADVWDSGRIVVQRIGGGERKELVEGGAAPRYLSTGHLVYAVSGTLRAIAFDLPSLAVSGVAIPVVEGVRRALGAGGQATGAAQITYSATGSLAYLPGPLKITDDGTDLALFDRKGGAEPLNLPPGAYSAPRVSPDGKLVAFERAGDRQINIWIVELSAGRDAQQLTFGGNNRAPVWSPDGLTVAFQSDREGDHAIFVQRADGSAAPQRLSKPDPGLVHVPQSWSRDGAHLLFSVQKGSEFTARSHLFSGWTLGSVSGARNSEHSVRRAVPEKRRQIPRFEAWRPPVLVSQG